MPKQIEKARMEMCATPFSLVNKARVCRSIKVTQDVGFISHIYIVDWHNSF